MDDATSTAATLREPAPNAPASCASLYTTSAFWRSLPAGMRRRWWLFRPFDLIARHWPVFRRRRGVLVVRMDGIGDMVLFRAAIDHYPAIFGVDKADITVLGCASWGSIADKVFEGFRVRVIDEHAFARNALYRFRVSLWVRGLAPAVAVCDSYLRRALMSDSLVWVSGAPKTVVSLPYVNESTRVEFSYYLSQVNRIIDTGVYPTHEVSRHFRFISAIAGRVIAPQAPNISWRASPPPIPPGAPYAVLNAGSNEPGRRWPIGFYAEIADRLLARGYRVALVGKSGEIPDEEARRAIVARPGAIDLTDKTSLAQLLDLMSHAALIVSNDTGPAHLAMALGRPTIVLVGGGHFGSFVPYPPEAAPPTARFVYQEMECYHCFWRCTKRATKFDVFPCISAIGIDRVWSAIEDLRARETAGNAPLRAQG
ncbi:MAG: glycosyltransferase family 9 protein [Rhodospirillales bacterium]|nr:glycosyltransferase family 9 protein [Rhodospirillales bacterium]